MGRNQQRQTIRNSLGEFVRIKYYRKDRTTDSKSPFNVEECYEGVLSTKVFKSENKFCFNCPISVKGCVDGEYGKKFAILPLDGPLHNVNCNKESNGYWEIEVINK